jgi:hypothetical protein
MTPKALSAPSIPAAESDGLIKLCDLTQDILVAFEAWGHSDEADVFQLIVKGVPVGPMQPVPVPLPAPGTILTLNLPKEELGSEGCYEVAYLVTNMLGGVSALSPSTFIHIDRTQPGATLLAPLIFPTATFSDQLTGLLPGYAGMQPGDLVQTMINASNGPTHTVVADELTLSPIEIVFTREHLQGHAPGIVSIEYAVTDRAGNTSITSLPTLVSVQL